MMEVYEFQIINMGDGSLLNNFSLFVLLPQPRLNHR